MAVVFELVVNFGRDESAVAAANDELERHSVVEVRGTQLRLTPPRVARFRDGEELTYIEFAVHPRGVGYPSSAPELPFAARDLSDAEISGIGEHLYELLTRFHDYEAAIVGWDPEEHVDVSQLESWLDPECPDGDINKLHGLVLADHLIERWQPQGFVAFDAGHSWLPYRGSSNAFR